VFGLNTSSPSVFRARPGFAFGKNYIFKDINIMNDVSLGQRGFARNLDGLLALMISYLKKYSK